MPPLALAMYQVLFDGRKIVVVGLVIVVSIESVAKLYLRKCGNASTEYQYSKQGKTYRWRVKEFLIVVFLK